jgi:PPOX class probable F420-dependent enzyme
MAQPTDAELLGWLAGAPHAYLASVRPDGHPHVVPITFAVRGRRLFTAVDHKPKRSAQLQRLANIHSHPRVSVLADHYEDDWAALWWVRADGRGRVIDAGPERDEGLAALARRYDAYRRTPPRGPVIAMDLERLVGWRARAGS